MLNRDFLPLKQYSIIVTGLNFTATRSVCVPYKTLDGSWRVIINISGIQSIAAQSITLTISGITFKTNTYGQSMGGTGDINDNSLYYCYASSGASTIVLKKSAAFDRVVVSGDVELDSKPTWME